ncbi:peptidase [Streptomyces sp. NBC_01619]|uniref:Clp protease N-terminal domain-containing protein n=1 Tax=Streptomyces pratisoli TaxID=3139917 RepID=A0ACC6QC96_9ACTN|nr:MULTISPECIES: Clp protease N-terminal domain-containing protein [unclassified Streptomyces]MCX4510382.1 peptidase [Streptomyces sp. NBC_01619]
MQFPVPRVPQQPVPTRAGTDAGLTEELASAVAGARRRALRDGDRQIDTAHLLHSLIESDPEVRMAFAGAGQLARVLGYLVQRSIGYGLRWQATVEDSGTLPVAGDPDQAGWSPSAAAAMEDALARAGRRGETRAAGLDLLAALAADRDCRAVDVLEHAGVDTARLAGRIGELSQQV